MKRKSSKSFSRRPRPLEENRPANTYRDSTNPPGVAAWPGNLRNAPGAAADAFMGIGKTEKPLSRRQRFEARKAKREQVAA